MYGRVNKTSSQLFPNIYCFHIQNKCLYGVTLAVSSEEMGHVSGEESLQSG